jgi:hypothetical protein
MNLACTVAGVGGVSPPRYRDRGRDDRRLWSRRPPAHVPILFCGGRPNPPVGRLGHLLPPDKKIIHGMQDAALLPCRAV